jgi:hypothetical protein
MEFRKHLVPGASLFPVAPYSIEVSDRLLRVMQTYSRPPLDPKT